jgi:curved DNA-binding protein CbpA
MSKEAIDRVVNASNFYETLNVNPDATFSEIKKSYYTLAVEVHPDKNINSPEAVDAFQRLKDAYDTLIDPQQRELYDQNLNDQTQKQIETGSSATLAITDSQEMALVSPGQQPFVAPKAKKRTVKGKKSTASEDDGDLDEEEEQEETQEKAQSQKPEEKKEKDPMLELLDDLNAFVSQTNKKITSATLALGKDAWDKLQNTQPMKTLNKALDEAKEFMNNKIDEGIDSVKNSEALTSAKSFVDGIKDKIDASFSAVMNKAADAIAEGIHKAVSSGDEPGSDNNEQQLGENRTETSLSQGADTEIGKNLTEALSKDKLAGLLTENDSALATTKTEEEDLTSNAGHRIGQ